MSLLFATSPGLGVLSAGAIEAASDVELAKLVFASPEPLTAFDGLTEAQQIAVMRVVEQNPSSYTLAARQSRASYYTDLVQSTNEKLECVFNFNPPACDTAAKDATTASNDAGARFPTSLADGKGDAYRHCLWNALMTKHLDSGRAKGISDIHERYHTSSAAAKSMDLFNNQKGRSAALISSSISIATSKCYVWANDGTLVTLK